MIIRRKVQNARPNSLPRLIPYLDSYDECSVERVSWREFVYKSARGSYKAAEWLRRATRAVIVEEYGPEVLDEPSFHVERLFAAPLPRVPPSWREFIHGLRCSEYLSPEFEPPDGYYAPRDYYEARWSKFTDAGSPGDYPSRHDEDCLTHDAARRCFDHWSGEEFIRVVGRTESDSYNSLDVVSGMLFLVIAWGGDPIWAQLVEEEGGKAE